MRRKHNEYLLHKKRFGQFFSGKEVSDKLVSLLPKKWKWHSVIDPMAGNGDMLASVAEHATDSPQMLGIEIDDAVANMCAKRLPEATIEHGDAFKSQKIVTPNGWDLVITNPPYVRYQLQNDDAGIMPSAQSIRENLIIKIEELSYISATEKSLFQKVAKYYSGLADMAVPAWILCSALTKKGGYLAVVVPETWLNRDYASPIQYLLSKCFHIETIAKDTNANWFPDAQVKTCLVIAKREEIHPLTNNSNKMTRVIDDEHDFVQPTNSLFPHLILAKGAKKWALKTDESFFAKKMMLPYELRRITGGKERDYISLNEMGIEFGQGLRTGANAFFYVQIKNIEGDIIRIKSNSWDNDGRDYSFSRHDLVLTLQKAGEVSGLIVRPDQLSTGTFYPLGDLKYDSQRYIKAAEQYRDQKGRRFKDFSAVKPNERKENGTIIREWFRLPKLTQRHLPNLCLTRVSANIPECLYIQQTSETPIAVDANMVTLWGKDEHTIIIVMALLNSTWSKVFLELICTVMGGGALKIEANHLKKLLLPKCNIQQLNAMEKCGRELLTMGIMTEPLQSQIDTIIASALKDNSLTKRLVSLLNQKYQERSKRE